MFLAVAVAVDALLEYPNAIHPTVLFGRIIGIIDKKRPGIGKIGEVALGATSELVLILVAIGLSLLPFIIPWWIARAAVYVFLLKSSFSIGGLIRHVRACETENYEELRTNVGKIVGRDLSSLQKGFLYSAAVESAAENTVDSALSPIIYYLIFGLPGALVYRAINTADAMVGYTDEAHVRFGKAAALIDYVANRPAALIFYLINLATWGKKSYGSARLKRGLRMNGVHPMLFYAKALNLRLVKKGYYVIGDGRLPEASDVKRAVTLTAALLYAFALISVLISYFYGLPRWF